MPHPLASPLRLLGRFLEPVLDPDAPARRLREAATEKQLDRVTRALTGLSEQVERMTGRVDRLNGRQLDHLEHAVRDLRWSTRRQYAFANRLLRDAGYRSEMEFTRERALRRITQVTRRDGPVLVGPWTGEVGFELLYWAPFVRAIIERFGIDPARVTILSRGGTASWYGIEGARYADVFELSSPEEFRSHTFEAKKQRTLRAYDRDLIRRASRRMGGRPAVLHPALMYALYMPYWKQQTSLRWVEPFALFRRVAAPVIPGLDLPADYVAVRFYFSECFPDTPENRAVVASTVHALAAETHVVLLGSGIRVDDHQDATMAESPRIHRVEHLMRPETNLAVQTAVIAGARAFVGTYGGYAYLAPLCGVKTLAFFSRRTYFPYHLDFAQHVFDQVEGGTLTVMDTAMRSLVGHTSATSVPAPPA